MPDLSSYKIPIVLGVNDAPVPPNFNDNGLGCNGAYFIDKYNSLVDDISSSLTYQSIDTSSTVSTWIVYGVDTSAGAVTLTLPAADQGDYIVFIDRASNFEVNNLDIVPANGDTIAGAEGLTLNHNQECVTLLYDADVNNWIIKEALVLGGLDDSAPDMSKVIISDTDTTAGTLSDKLVAGSNVTLTRLNPGGYEQFRIAATTNDANKIINGTSEVDIPNVDGNIYFQVGDVQAGIITSDSIYLGNQAGIGSISTEGNVGLGESAAVNLSTGIRNTLIGSQAGSSVTAGSGNTSLGRAAGASVTVGENNIYLGYGAGDTSANNPLSLLTGSLSGSNNIVIGYGALPTAVGSSNEIVIGNGNHSYLTIPGVNFRLDGVSMAAAVSGQVLSYDGVAGQWIPTTLGTAAALNVGTSANNVVQLDGSGRLPAVDGSALRNLPNGDNAAAITVSTAGFNNNLSGADTTVQTALETLDSLVINGGSGGGHIIQDEGTPKAQRANLNFVGNAVSIADDSGNDASVVMVNLPATGSGLNFGTWDSAETFTTGVRFDGTEDKILIPIATSNARSSRVLLEGELLYDTDNNTLYYGDGVTLGGNTYDLSTKLDVSSVSGFALTYLSNITAGQTLTTLGISAFAQTVLDDATASDVLTTLGVSTFAETLLDDATADEALTTLGVSTFAKTLLNDQSASTALSTLGVSTFAKTLLDDTTASGVLTTLGVSTFAKTLLDDTTASGALTTLGISSFAKTLLDDSDSAAALTTLGISAFAQTLLDDSDSTTVLSTLGVSPFAQTILDDLDASAVRTTLGAAPADSPNFTGTPAAPTAAVDTNTTQVATTAFVQDQIGASVLNSPAFTGVPTAPTAAVNTNTTQLATTEFVQTQIGTLGGQSGAPLDSPAFTGTPTAPTAVVDTNTTQLATTAFVQTQIAAPFTRGITDVAALDINCSSGNYFTKSISSNSIFTFSNVPSGVAYSFTLEVTHSGGTITWPTSVKWSTDTAPTLTTGKTHLFIFVTDNGGSRWRGAALVDYTN